jgi:hypothetical protein
MNNLLDNLTSPDFLSRLGYVTSPKAARRCLLACQEVKNIRNGLARGAVTEEGIRLFVSELMHHFEQNVQFFHEPALAALAVVLETWNTPFSEEYLIDLARLNRIAEMSFAPRVAGLCLQEQSKLPRVTRKIRKHTNRITPRWSFVGRVPRSAGDRIRVTKFKKRARPNAEP